MPTTYGVGSKKSSYTISKAGAIAADHLAVLHAGGNVSLVVDVALKHLATLPSEQVERMISREQADRAVSGSRNAWMRAFWNWLARLNGASSDPIDNVYAPRSWNDHTIVFLLKSATEYPDENDGFILHTWSPTTAGQVLLFPRDTSPVDAAERTHQCIKSAIPVAK